RARSGNGACRYGGPWPQPARRITVIQWLEALPWQVAGGFSTGMAKLNSRDCAEAADENGKPAVGRDGNRRIYSGAFIGLASALFHRCFFREYDAGAAYRVFSKADEMPIGRATALRAILAHWRNDDAIAGKNPAQGNRLKKDWKADASIMHGGHLLIRIL